MTKLRATATHSQIAPLIRAAKRLAQADKAWRTSGMSAARKRSVQAAVQDLLAAASELGAKIIWRKARP